MEEAVAGDGVDEEIFAKLPGRAMDGADGSEGVGVGAAVAGAGEFGAGGEVGVYSGEGGEVMDAADGVGSVLEDSEVEAVVTVPYVGREHGGADEGHVVRIEGRGIWAGWVDAVLVCFCDGAVAGVEAGRCGFE